MKTYKKPSQPLSEAELNAQLASLRAPPEGEDVFMRSLHSALVTAKVNNQDERNAEGWFYTFMETRRGLVLGLSGALAGAAAMWVVFSVAAPSPKQTSQTQASLHPSAAQVTQPSMTQLSTTKPTATPQALAPEPTLVANAPSIPQSKVALIKLVFNSEVAVKDVDFSIELPEGVAFWSEGALLEERALSWKGELTPGENIVPVAVRGTQTGQYRVRAKARVGDKLLEHDVVFNITSEI